MYKLRKVQTEEFKIIKEFYDEKIDSLKNINNNNHGKEIDYMRLLFHDNKGTCDRIDFLCRQKLLINTVENDTLFDIFKLINNKNKITFKVNIQVFALKDDQTILENIIKSIIEKKNTFEREIFIQKKDNFTDVKLNERDCENAIYDFLRIKKIL